MKSNTSRESGGVFLRARTDIPRSPRFRGRFRPGWGVCALPQALLALMAMCGLPGCALHGAMCSKVSCQHAVCPRPHVEIFRGLGGYMPGSGDLQERLAARGI